MIYVDLRFYAKLCLLSLVYFFFQTLQIVTQKATQAYIVDMFF